MCVLHTDQRHDVYVTVRLAIACSPADCNAWPLEAAVLRHLMRASCFWIATIVHHMIWTEVLSVGNDLQTLHLRVYYVGRL